ncbi:hypothetical protein GQ43DRAFT_436920 [Delitschia confertaspora ATCC 74209]|uniref:Lipid droplet-associated hydrolase n=1 Tax=Delitschia confertaspora ATCC 74209 TaxID=1513339 RepID=A0A9P4MWX9_9PLEO|nr:hypothetical protein GQ43DRAFT_436920 [Delitschia confertaspora ATCC 74209]
MTTSQLPSIIHLRNPTPTAPNNAKPKQTYIIYFITGNPGLIEYYRTFHTHLYALLSTSNQNVDFQIYGRSLSGFEVDNSSTDNTNKNRVAPPYSLQDQIQNSGKALEDLINSLVNQGIKAPQVILIGHSVGSYILLELIRSFREGLIKAPEKNVKIVGGICLFPTVTHIAKSASGRRAGWLICQKHTAAAASVLARLLLLLIPTNVLSSLISVFMSFPQDAARTTATFAKSKHGILQALHMARDEMHEITSDTWDEEVWGAAHPSPSQHPRPVLRFLFAKSDHWVADETRDELMKVRARVDGVEEWKPKMEIDEKEGWPHAFCIRHSIPVAGRVKEYIDDIIESSS